MPLQVQRFHPGSDFNYKRRAESALQSSATTKSTQFWLAVRSLIFTRGSKKKKQRQCYFQGFFSPSKTKSKIYHVTGKRQLGDTQRVLGALPGNSDEPGCRFNDLAARLRLIPTANNASAGGKRWQAGSTATEKKSLFRNPLAIPCYYGGTAATPEKAVFFRCLKGRHLSCVFLTMAIFNGEHPPASALPGVNGPHLRKLW